MAAAAGSAEFLKAVGVESGQALANSTLYGIAILSGASVSLSLRRVFAACGRGVEGPLFVEERSGYSGPSTSLGMTTIQVGPASLPRSASRPASACASLISA